MNEICKKDFVEEKKLWGGGLKSVLLCQDLKSALPPGLNEPEPHFKSSLSQWSSHRQGNSACCC